MKKTVYKTAYAGPTMFIIIMLAVCVSLNAGAQVKDSLTVPAKDFRNSIKLNITSRILYNNSLQFAYERVISKKQTVNVFAGYNEFPVDLKLNLANTELTAAKKRSGYSLGADYRFYLASENKYDAPRGVYLAPFVTFYHFNTDRGIRHTDSSGIQSAILNSKISFLNIGGELGYQFVLGKRWVIDAIVLGPAYTHYNLTAKIDSDIDGISDNETVQAVIDALKQKFPLLDELSKEHEINSSGSEKFWSVGFRYSISVGFRF